ncbi:FAD/NAD(P)-binding protein [Kitasatospora kifunensis]|uniref:Putative NAD(P)/FAD-binding protein YdhS n=1 Tax=Kitasatospora kifunensis TaxID=58351 RepID=A0A7W7QX88_KITKI|nr:FAD/NAD(P)-binding protein [Kitasatospora kifunensis]MBB4921350.1 putative NAD(P)/FAD-binding protein YdhS [Kitasatospora kifunensis]
MNTSIPDHATAPGSDHLPGPTLDAGLDAGLDATLVTADRADSALRPGTPGSAVRRVAVVGAGAAGTLTAAQLLYGAAERQLPLEVWLIDPAETVGAGVAYGTEDLRHLLNVPAGAMSAFPDDPDHFLRWLAAWEPCPASTTGHQPHDFLPRHTYGRYLAHVLHRAVVETAAFGRLHQVRRRVVDAAQLPEGVELTLADGERLTVQAAVLALGLRPPGRHWAPPALREHPAFVADPWAPGALASVPTGGDVLLVGTGLTMADTAITLARPGRVVHAVSRHGLAPYGHRATPAPALTCTDSPAAPAGLTEADGLDDLRRAVLRHLARARRNCGDWRPGIDSLRPLTSTLWQRLSDADRARFLREDLRQWEVHRHRLAPATAAALAELLDRDRLTIAAAEVADAQPAADDAVRVRLSDGRTLTASAVVNCTGAPAELTSSDDALHRALFQRGLATAGPVGLGLATADDGRLRPAARQAPAPLWTLGLLRRGELLESTAMPEIRGQAADLARAVLHALTATEPPSIPIGEQCTPTATMAPPAPLDPAVGAAQPR